MNKRNKLIVSFIIMSFIISFSDVSEARKRRRRRAKQPKVINEKKLFERLGGKPVLENAVNDWFQDINQNESKHPTLTAKLKPICERTKDLQVQSKKMYEELCEISDGPCPEKEHSAWLDLRESVQLSDSESIELVSVLSEILVKKGVGEREHNELLGRIGAIEPFSSTELTGPANERRGGTR